MHTYFWVLGNYCYIPVNEFENRWHQLSHDNLHLIHWGMAVSKETPAFNPQVFLPIK